MPTFVRNVSRKLPDKIKGKIVLPEIDREYTLYEVATAMSAGPARALGLMKKGNLAPGCDADVVIYEEDPVDVVRTFSHPRYVIKAGEVVIEDGEIRETPEGKEFLVKPDFAPGTDDFMKPLFEDVYTMQFENYPVELERIERRDMLNLGTE